MNFPKLHLITLKDDIRPALDLIEITKKSTQSTDCFAAVILSTEELFGDLFKDLAGEVYVSSGDWKKFCAPGVTKVGYHFDTKIFEVFSKNGKSELFKAAICEGRFPAISQIMPEELGTTELRVISLDPSLLLKVSEAIYPATWRDSKPVALYFNGANKAIEIKPSSKENKLNVKAILMPTMFVG